MSKKDPKGNLLKPSGQTLADKKLVIEGVIHQTIHYVADNCEQNIMVFDNSYCFGTFVVEPYTALSLSGDLPTGYSYSNNTLTIQNSALDAGLTFVSKSSECNIVINLKVDVNTIIKKDELGEASKV